MLSLERRIALMADLGRYMLSGHDDWVAAQDRAVQANAWFNAESIALAANNIATQFLNEEKLQEWAGHYFPGHASEQQYALSVGIVMAGNIPLVGFHDMLCGFISGHRLQLKLSSKDDVLLKHLINTLTIWEPAVAEQITIADRLNGCDAYIATGSNNTARYFEQYFGKYPHIIRRNRTSVALLDGIETKDELSQLADDIFMYYGLGCRNVTQVCIPQGYDLTRLIDACNKYSDIINHNKYKNNFDYYLAIYLLNRVPYLSNDAMLVVENASPFSAVSVLHYRYYDNKNTIEAELGNNADIQCVVGHGNTAFGTAQSPSLYDYADGLDTMAFLTTLPGHLIEEQPSTH